MGLLTDPNAGQGKIIKNLTQHHNTICFCMYLGSIVWFCLLAHNSVSITTYFSENALLPGLVKSEFSDGNVAQLYYQELLDEMKNYEDTIPYPWLLAKFRQIGLDTYTHNFTLNYPLGTTKKYTGKNVYGILRAARAASTESVVLSVPYRSSTSVHPKTAPAIAVMLAFAKFANREKYWAKDIIFLVTEHEQLGVQAWLEAYHSTSCGTVGTLEHGDLRGRAGAIQAAINLELHDINIGRIDIKIEGLNGHLPNLDLVTLVNRMCIKESVFTTFKNRYSYRSYDTLEEWWYSLRTLLSMVATQSTGVPNGNHGLFHRFGIEAVTMEGFSKSKNRPISADLYVLGRILEGIFRSLNNLLERFHQSFFFYLLSSPDKFVSIGLYIPVIISLGGALFVKPCAQWYKITGRSTFSSVKETEEEKKKAKSKRKDTDNIDLVRIGIIVLLTHTLGVCIMNLPKHLTKIGLMYGYSTDVSVYYGFAAFSLILLFLPLLLPGKNTVKNMQVLNIFANLEMGTAIIAIGMMNFSLALFCGAIYVPIILLIAPVRNSVKSIVQRVLWILVNPFLVMNIVVLINTYLLFPNEVLPEIFSRGIVASQQALMYSIVDSLIYGNWLYKVATAILLPNWLCLWFVQFPTVNAKDKLNVSSDKKTN